NDPALCDREGGCADGFPAPLPSFDPGLPNPERDGAAQARRPADQTGPSSEDGSVCGLSGNFDGLWANCPPDMYGTKRPLALGPPRRAYFAGAIHKVFALGAGEKLDIPPGTPHKMWNATGILARVHW